MQVKKLVEAQRRYHELQDTIDSIEEVLDKFAEAKMPPGECANSILVISGWTINGGTRYENVSIPDSVSRLIEIDVIELLKARHAELTLQRDALEVS